MFLLPLSVLVLVGRVAIAAPQERTLSGIRAEGNHLVNKDGQVVNLRVSARRNALHACMRLQLCTCTHVRIATYKAMLCYLWGISIGSQSCGHGVRLRARMGNLRRHPQRIARGCVSGVEEQRSACSAQRGLLARD